MSVKQRWSFTRKSSRSLDFIARNVTISSTKGEKKSIKLKQTQGSLNQYCT
jgi:hypothetical protein